MIRVGVIGAGYWGFKHLRVFHELRGSDLYIVCDEDPAKLEQVRHYFPSARTTVDYREMLESDVEAIVVATPVGTHFSIAKDALLAGKHVLVEKPLTSEMETARELVTLAEQRSLTLMVGHTYLFHPAVEFMRDYLASGELGNLYYLDSARLNLGVFRSDVDVLWDLAPHDISIMLFLLDQDPTWISARGTAHINPSLAEVSYISLGFPDQVLAHTHVSWLDPSKVRRLTMVGSKKMVVFDELAAPEDQVRIYNKGASLSQNGSGGNGLQVQYRYGDITAPFIPYAEPLKNECAHLLESIRDGSIPRSNGREALRVISILEAAHQSQADGGGPVNMQSTSPSEVGTNGSRVPSGKKVTST